MRNSNAIERSIFFHGNQPGLQRKLAIEFAITLPIECDYITLFIEPEYPWCRMRSFKK